MSTNPTSTQKAPSVYGADLRQTESRFEQKQGRNKQTPQEAREMQRFEQEYMRMLTRASIQRFASSNGVPAADTQESLIEACSRTAAVSSAATSASSSGNKKDNNNDNNSEDVEPRQKVSASKKPNFRGPVELDLEAKLLSKEEASRLRASQDLLWLSAVPSRLRDFLVSHSSPTSSSAPSSSVLNSLSAAASVAGTKLDPLDIYCDIVIRLPIVGVGREEVVAFCSPFGNCEYLGPCFDSIKNKEEKEEEEEEEEEEEKEKSKKKKKKEKKKCRDFCHIVHFERGIDAIQCFVELNGYFLDPHDCKIVLETIVANAVTNTTKTAAAAATAQQEHELEEDDRKARDHLFQNVLPKALPQLHVSSGESFEQEKDDQVLRCWSSRLIFVTCEFFRSAFFNKQALVVEDDDDDDNKNEFIPRAEMITRSVYESIPSSSSSSSSSSKATSSSSSSSSSSQGFFSSWFSSSQTKLQQEEEEENKKKKKPEIPSEWNPADIVCDRLKRRARDITIVFPLATSHKDIEWVGICRAANTVAMFIPFEKQKKQKQQKGQKQEGEGDNEDEQNNSSSNLWTITLRALRLCKVNVVALFRAIDDSSSIENLLEASKRFSSRTSFENTFSNKKQKKVSLNVPPSPKKGETENAGSNDDDNIDDDPDEKKSKKNKAAKKNNKKKEKGEEQSLFEFSFGSFFSPDPANGSSNRLVEGAALVIAVFAVVWIIVAILHIWITQPHLRALKHEVIAERMLREDGDL